jgi:DNA-binding PadR family transcriptional regulator
LTVLGHKKRPQHPEKTIQTTLQNMRDKNWITFFGQGDYKITDDGYKELLAQKENIDIARNITPEQLKVMRKLAETS